MVARLLNSTTGLVSNTVGAAGNLVGGLLGGNSGPGKSGSAPGHTGLAPPGQGGPNPGHSHASEETKKYLEDSFTPQSAPAPTKDAEKQAKEAEKDAEKEAKGNPGVPAPGAPTPGAPSPNAPVPGAPAPGTAGVPDVFGRKSPSGSDPWISQFDPVGKDGSYSNGEQNCAPAVAAMVARNVNYRNDLSEAQLIMHLGEIGGTTGAGTSGNGLIAMYEHMGLDTNAKAGADLGWITQELQAGHHVNVLGDYYEVPGRIDPAQTSGHYLDVTAVTKEGNFLVNDPADQNVTQLSPAQLTNFMTSAPSGGFAISAWQANPALG